MIITCPNCSYTGDSQYDFEGVPNNPVNIVGLAALFVLVFCAGICVGGMISGP